MNQQVIKGNVREVRKAMHCKQFDSASQILDIVQGQPLLAAIAASASRKMLYHLRELHELAIAEIDAKAEAVRTAKANATN